MHERFSSTNNNNNCKQIDINFALIFGRGFVNPRLLYGSEKNLGDWLISNTAYCNDDWGFTNLLLLLNLPTVR